MSFRIPVCTARFPAGLLIVLTLGGALLFSTAGASRWFAPNLHHRVAAQSDEPKPQIETELIAVRAFGFEPAAIRRPKGDFILLVRNRSPFPELILHLSRIEGSRPAEKLKDASLPKGKVNWLDHENLPPGEYLLTAENHPDWKCFITITAQ